MCHGFVFGRLILSGLRLLLVVILVLRMSMEIGRILLLLRLVGLVVVRLIGLMAWRVMIGLLVLLCLLRYLEILLFLIRRVRMNLLLFNGLMFLFDRLLWVNSFG